MGGSLPGVIAAIAPAPVHAADLFLTGEREVYLAVDKLNAMGRLPGFLANTRPYSVAAVRAEGEIALEKVKNPAGIPDSPAEDASFRVALSYQFGAGE